MGAVIRMGLVVAGIAVVLVLVMPVLTQVGSGVMSVAEALPALISQVTPFLSAGRSLLNAFIGYPILVDVLLWLNILAPLTLALCKLAIYIQSKLVG